MPTETIRINGKSVKTLAEMLKPGLKCVIVGLNPSPLSVEAGHYYQGQLGKRLWKRLQQAKILDGLTPGAEDEDAFAQGFGFADLVRRPTPRAKGLDISELESGAADLIDRLKSLGDPKPRILFVFAQAALAAAAPLEQAGFQTLHMPAPYAKLAEVDAALKRIRRSLQGA